jgi:hypothetical protein
MADDVDEGVEGSFKRLLSVTERSGNLIKDLKKEILEAVSSLRHYFAQVQTKLEVKTTANKELESDVKACKEDIQWLRNNACSRTRPVAPSMDTVRGRKPVRDRCRLLSSMTGNYMRKQRDQKGDVKKRYKLLISSRTDHSVQAIKTL